MRSLLLIRASRGCPGTQPGGAKSPPAWPSTILLPILELTRAVSATRTLLSLRIGAPRNLTAHEGGPGSVSVSLRRRGDLQKLMLQVDHRSVIHRIHRFAAGSKPPSACFLPQRAPPEGAGRCRRLARVLLSLPEQLRCIKGTGKEHYKPVLLEVATCSLPG